jgi:hypothetical protein
MVLKAFEVKEERTGHEDKFWCLWKTVIELVSWIAGVTSVASTAHVNY